MGENELTTGQNRLQGYRSAFGDVGLRLDPALICIGSFSRQHGEAATVALLDAILRPPPPFWPAATGSHGGFAGVDQTQACHPSGDLGRRVNDTEWLQIWDPPITTVDVAVEEMAHLAVELLLQRIAAPNKQVKPREYLLGTSLSIRDSCRAIVPAVTTGE